MSAIPKVFIVAAAGVIAVAGIGFATLNLIAEPEEPARRIVVKRLEPAWTPPEVEPAVAVEHDPAPQPPPIEGTDPIVRAAVAELSSHPTLGSWLISDGLVRRFVAAVEAVAGGYSPRESVAFLRPDAPFLVRESEGRLVIARSSYHRYDLVTQVFTSIDNQGAATLYRQLKPAIDAAHREIAWFSDDFDSRLDEAIEHLLEVEIPADEIEVEAGLVTYTFGDAAFEQLTDAQRQLLRLGPDNARRIQAKLRELQKALTAAPISRNT
jgi:hypothetical protein